MPDPTKNIEISKYWTLNQTGNILVSSTVQEEKDLRDACVVEFQKVSVLYDAISTAIARKKRTVKGTGGADVSLGLFDYTAISAVIAQCGFFALMHEEDRTYTHNSFGMSVDTAIVTEILGDVSGAGPVMDIAKGLLKTMGGKAQKLNLDEKDDSKKVRLGHLLFICEDCMGMPLVSLQVISINQDQLSWSVNTPCSSTTSSRFSMNYKMETFMFVDPVCVSQFSHEFKASDDFNDLIERLTSSIPDTQ